MKPPSPQLLRVLRRCAIGSGTKQSTNCRQISPLLHVTKPASHHHQRRGFASPPTSRDRGPASKEDTQTDFNSLDVLGSTPPPATSIDVCVSDGFVLGNSVRITDGDGCLLVGGEAFRWRPWEASEGKLVNTKGQWQARKEVWGILELIWPKPDILVIGLGPTMRPLSPDTRSYLSSLGIRIDIQDTRNAAAQFNLLATERGVGTIAAALIPIGHEES